MANITPRASLERIKPTDALLNAFAEFLRLEVANGDAALSTIRSYHYIVQEWVAWCKARGIDPARATIQDVRAYRADLIQHGYARATIAWKLTIIRRLYEAAVTNGLRPDNPAKGVKPPPDLTPRTEKVKWLPASAIRQLLSSPKDTPKGRRDRAILALMALHGLRVLEVVQLNLDDLDLENNRIRVLGKGRKIRTILLVDHSRRILKDWLEVRDLIAAPGEEAVFVNLRSPRNPKLSGHRITTRGVRTMVNGYLRKLGLKQRYLSCHALRHSFATLSRAAGARLDAISRALGHSSLRTTMVYADIVDQELENPARFLETLLGETGETP